MTSLNHLLRAFVLLALFVCLSQGCGKSDSPTADPEPFKAAVAQYLEQNNMAMALKQIKDWPDHRRQDRYAHGFATACDHSGTRGYLDVSLRAKRRRNLERGQSQVTHRRTTAGRIR